MLGRVEKRDFVNSLAVKLHGFLTCSLTIFDSFQVVATYQTQLNKLLYKN